MSEPRPEDDYEKRREEERLVKYAFIWIVCGFVAASFALAFQNVLLGALSAVPLIIGFNKMARLSKGKGWFRPPGI